MKIREILAQINEDIKVLDGSKVLDMGEFHHEIAEVLKKSFRKMGLVGILEYGTWSINLKSIWEYYVEKGTMYSLHDIFQSDVFDFIDNKSCKYKRKGKLVTMSFKLHFPGMAELELKDIPEWIEKTKLESAKSVLEAHISEAKDNLSKYESQLQEVNKQLNIKPTKRMFYQEIIQVFDYTGEQIMMDHVREMEKKPHCQLQSKKPIMEESEWKFTAQFKQIQEL